MKTRSYTRQAGPVAVVGMLCLVFLPGIGPRAFSQEKEGPYHMASCAGLTAADAQKSKQKSDTALKQQKRTATSAIAPGNDNFAAAALLGASGTTTGTNVAATGEPGEPIHGAGHGADPGFPNQFNSVWYKIVPQATGVVEFKTAAAPNDPIDDTVISAYTGSTVNTLTPIAENDDHINTYYSRITFGVQAGQTYYVAVDGYRTATGGFQLIHQFSATPFNDHSFSPEDLNSLDDSPFIGITGSNVGGTQDLGEQTHHSNSAIPINSIWYTWTPPVSGTYTFTTEGSNFDTILAVYYSFGSGPILGSSGSNDDFGPAGTLTSRVTFYASTAFTYRIAIDGYAAAVGNSLLNWYPSFEESGKRFDLTGDRLSDISIFRPSNGQWWIKPAFGDAIALTFGTGTDKPVPADFTGDGKVDVAVWRPGNGFWYVLRSEDYSYYALAFGTSGDIPAPAKFDNDDKADHAVFRPSNGTWYIRRSRTGTAVQQGFGIPGDVPVVADYDADGAADIAIYRPSNGQWWVNRSRDGVIAMTFGATGDLPVPGPYTGKGYSNVAFWRPATGEWFVLREFGSASYYSFPFGLSTDLPAPADYDGDGKYDATVFRPSTGVWYSQRANGFVQIQQFGLPGDRPLANSFIP